LRLSVTRGQLKHETEHLLKKLQQRDPTIFRKLSHRKVLQPHPCFKTVPGPIEAWEKAPGLY
jgi:hypothetical protein